MSSTPSRFKTARSRLYRGETTFGFIDRRRVFYAASAILLLICILSMVFRGFNLGIDFRGGSQFQIAATGTSLKTADVSKAFDDAGIGTNATVQEVGNGSSRSFVVTTEVIEPSVEPGIASKIEKQLNLSKPISFTSVSSSWGSDISKKAVQGLIVFLIAVAIYIAIRFQGRMAAAALGALLHDLVLTAGVYSIVGFEVTPSTVVGLLTILGFSLYDTVVVFDKIGENTKDLTAGSRMTFSDATNLAVNQTLMRSINTSLISILPVAGLLFIGAGLLGVGDLKDLALVMFVGLITGAYSSLFLAAPIVVELTERRPEYKALTKRVAAKRSSEAARLASGDAVLVGGRVRDRVGGPAPAPRPGARPQNRPTANRTKNAPRKRT